MIAGMTKLDMAGWLGLISVALIMLSLMVGCRSKEADESAGLGQVELATKPRSATTQALAPKLITRPSVKEASTQSPRVEPAEPSTKAELRQMSAYEHYLKALEYRNQGEYDKATAEFERVIKRAPEFSKAYINLARTQLKQGKPKQAIAPCDRALKIKPDAADAYNVRGLGYMDQGLYREAIVEFQKAIAADPKSTWPHNNLGLCHLRLGDLDQAATRFAQAVKLGPGIALMHNNLGAALEKKGQFRAAQKEFEAALKIEPNYRKASASLARVSKLTPVEAKVVALQSEPAQ